MPRVRVLEVPVRYKAVVDGVPVIKRSGMMHDTGYSRGATSVAELTQQWDADMQDTGHNRWSPEYVMEVVPPFTARVRVIESTKYRSAVFFTVEDEAGDTWPMFLTDMTALLRGANMDKGWTDRLTFETCKRGTAYGIRVVP